MTVAIISGVVNYYSVMYKILSLMASRKVAIYTVRKTLPLALVNFYEYGGLYRENITPGSLFI